MHLKTSVAIACLYLCSFLPPETKQYRPMAASQQVESISYLKCLYYFFKRLNYLIQPEKAKIRKKQQHFCLVIVYYHQPLWHGDWMYSQVLQAPLWTVRWPMWRRPLPLCPGVPERTTTAPSSASLSRPEHPSLSGGRLSPPVSCFYPNSLCVGGVNVKLTV